MRALLAVMLAATTWFGAPRVAAAGSTVCSSWVSNNMVVGYCTGPVRYKVSGMCKRAGYPSKVVSSGTGTYGAVVSAFCPYQYRATAAWIVFV